MGVLTFVYMSLLVSVIFGAPDAAVPLVPIFGQLWPSWVFSLTAMIVVLIFGLGNATMRASYLFEKELLSNDWLDTYLFVRGMSLPVMLGALTQVSLMCAGLILYGATGSTFIVLLSFFCPLLLGLSGYILNHWCKNSCRLVVWPPEDVEDEDFDDEEDDYEEDEDYNDELPFELPPLDVASDGEDGDFLSIKMPALPLKSSLKKRQEDEKKKRQEEQVRLVAEARYVEEKTKEMEQERLAQEKAEANKETNEQGQDLEIPEEQLVVVKSQKRSMSKKIYGSFTRCFQKFRSTANVYKEVAMEGAAKMEEADASAEDAEDDNEVDFESMSVLQAFLDGYLLPADYRTLAASSLLVHLLLLFGVVVSAVEEPSYAGNVIWIAGFVLIFSIVPCIKLFYVFKMERGMLISLGFSWLLMWIGGFVMFVDVYDSDPNLEESLVIFMWMWLYPAYLGLAVALLYWKDNDWQWTNTIDKVVKVAGFFIFQHVWMQFGFGGFIVGFSFSFALGLGLFMLMLAKQYAANDRYLPPRFQRLGDRVIKSVWFGCWAMAIFNPGNFFYWSSLAFLAAVIKLSVTAAGIYFSRDPDTLFFFSPYIFPCFSFNPATNDVVSENHLFTCIYGAMAVCEMWGIFCAVFISPTSVGVGITCLVLVVFMCFTAMLASDTPVRMGQATKFVDEAMFLESGAAARTMFTDRRKKLKIKCQEYVDRDRQLKREELEFEAMSTGKRRHITDDEDLDEIEVVEKRKTAAELAIELDNARFQCGWTELPDRDVRNPDAPFTFADAVADTLRGGHGPFGWLVGNGHPYKLYAHCFFDPAHNKYNKDGSRKNLAELPPKPMVDSKPIYQSLDAIDEKLALEYYEEIRCIIHFQMLVMQGAESRIRRERILFQKFLRENRFKLMSNGINPPSDIFKTSSFASIDIPHVAIWLGTLTPEERERFHLLKQNFSEEIAERDILIDAEDAQRMADAEEVLAMSKHRGEVMARRRYGEFQARRQRRAENGEELVDQDGDGDVDDEDEMLQNCKETLQEIESGYNCQPGKYGRPLQFIDPDFPHTHESIGEIYKLDKVTDWRVSTGININAGLYEGGTDPDDVRQGVLNDGWFLSALSIIAASGGVDDAAVDPLIGNLFQPTEFTSSVGAYSVRLHKNGEWHAVVVDDFFPVLNDSHKTDISAGAAFCHSKNCEELWPMLIEKAYAKYHGGFESLEVGYVHHALQDLSGFHSYEVSLAKASRGASRKQLWMQLKQYHSNGYLLGAGSVTSDSADNEIQDIGLVFGQAYTIYDVRAIDGYELIKLRNPPGDHPEWRGDWGDLSPLWNLRLKKKCGWTDEDDNTFWMSFSDFCNAFRSLYVCEYMNPQKWKKVQVSGSWSVEGDLAAGLPHPTHNEGCTIESNPQYVLEINRPTEVHILLRQIDKQGLAVPEPHPIAFYVCRNDVGGRATRVKELTADTVVCHSGDVLRSHEANCKVVLNPGTYTLLCATYEKGQEGPYMLTLFSNYALDLEQLWPAPWRERKEPTTFMEKMQAHAEDKAKKGLEKAKDATEKHRTKAAALANKAASAGTAALGDTGDVAISKEDAAAKEKETQDDPNTLWKEKFDKETGKIYYYNKQTGMSSYDVPEGFQGATAIDPEGDAAANIQAVFRGRKARKPKGPKCSICQKKLELEGALCCANDCGAKIHPTCNGYNENNPAPETWYCAICDES